jgi:hypothetical protein
MLTLLTATGNRPFAWTLCQRWMSRQTFRGPVRWVIVDDGRQAQEVSFSKPGWELEVIRPTPLWRLGDNTQARNLLAGLDAIGNDASVAIIEDDDWYAPDWLAHVSEQLQCAELVGETRARYYNVVTRISQQLNNSVHASLCSTALRGPALLTLREACLARQKFIDLDLWRRHQPNSHLFDGHRVVGIKGLPGRGGIGMGHREDMRGPKDRSGALLRAWIGADVEHYRSIEEGSHASPLLDRPSGQWAR